MRRRSLLTAAAGLLAGSSIAANPNANPPESAANKHMHEMSFEHLVARFDDPARKEWQKPDQVIAELGPLTGKTVADIGAGTGRR